MELRYVKAFKTPLKALKGGKGDTLTNLLWGDPVHIINSTSRDTWLEVMARNHDKGYIKRSALMDKPILEIYIIDVGQGDGVLMKTPDNKWHLIDAGTTNSRQPSGRGAANFVRFKFIEDLRMDKVQLENLILTHPDLDHYGGMIDLLSGKLDGWPEFEVEVGNFYHNGMGKFTKTAAQSFIKKGGEIEAFPIGTYNKTLNPDLISPLLENAADFNSNRNKFSKEFKTLAGLVTSKIGKAQRIDRNTAYLPGYGLDNNELKIHVLGPVSETYKTGEIGLRQLQNDSKTVNGHSVILRVDFKKAKILLTGDLNQESQELLLNYIPKEEFKADVAKGCHHGSDDILFEFLLNMNPKATIISSGDNEGYAHPKPVIVGASAFYGSTFRDEKNRELPPLVYSTELARSVKYVRPLGVKTRTSPTDTTYDDHEIYNTLVTVPGNDKKKIDRTMAHVLLADNFDYGLVSVRTDGETILIANKIENRADFDIQLIKL